MHPLIQSNTRSKPTVYTDSFTEDYQHTEHLDKAVDRVEKDTTEIKDDIWNVDTCDNFNEKWYLTVIKHIKWSFKPYFKKRGKKKKRKYDMFLIISNYTCLL